MTSRTLSGFRIETTLSDGAGGHIYFRGEHEPELETWMRQILRPGDTFLDVGANIGYFSLFAASLGCRAIAVEPIPANIAKLERNLALNPDFSGRIQVLPYCVSDTPGKVTMRLPPHNCGEGTLGTKDGAPVDVNARRLDDLISPERAQAIRFVKMDIEGAELLALRGAAAILPHLRFIVVEIHPNAIIDGAPDDVFELMRNAGFEARALNGGAPELADPRHPTHVIFRR